MRSTNGADWIYVTITHLPQWYKPISPGKGEQQHFPDAVLFLSLAFWFLSCKCWQSLQSFMGNTPLCTGITLAGWGDTVHTWGTCTCPRGTFPPDCHSPGEAAQGTLCLCWARGHAGSGFPVLSRVSCAATAPAEGLPCSKLRLVAAAADGKAHKE